MVEKTPEIRIRITTEIKTGLLGQA